MTGSVPTAGDVILILSVISVLSAGLFIAHPDVHVGPDVDDETGAVTGLSVEWCGDYPLTVGNVVTNTSDVSAWGWVFEPAPGDECTTIVSTTPNYQ